MKRTLGSSREMPNNTFLCPHSYVTYQPDVVNQAYASYIVNIVLNCMFCLPAAVLNGLVVIAVFVTPSLRRPSNLLLCSLAITDLGTGLVAQPMHAASRAAEVVGDFPTFCTTWLYSRVIGRWLTNASLYTVTAISVDRVLAITLGYKYRSIITTKKVIAVLSVLWAIAALIACVRLFAHKRIFLPTVAYSYILCIFIMSFAYFKAFRALERYQCQGAESAIDVPTYKRSLHTMLYIVTFVVVCYLPFIILATYHAITGRNPVERAAWTIVDTVVFLNSVLNPILYYWRLAEFRNAVWDILRRCCRCERTSGEFGTTEGTTAIGQFTVVEEPERGERNCDQQASGYDLA